MLDEISNTREEKTLRAHIVIIDVIADVKISIISFNRSLVILPLMG